ncbi:hypothetical protein KUG47_03910 [Falsochrobactrum sp. TDYN1]|uniref:Uncharacterized protein n=1 Tax=Falsochrobactrum tianjinense TaxID=2706015 RepID=A0A949PMD7_9HYPH|nr:hypothetical protein [Falsochrobactrum sp. TDYN1]MBV2142644.1 hypothetical protein [Falsochrobactrum sp. TDYN1]
MNIAMKLTFDGLVRALRFRQLAVREDLALGRRPGSSEIKETSGERYDERRSSIAEGPV